MYSSASFLCLAVILLLPVASPLQVTPGSSCAPVCLDDPTGNPLDANASSTNVTDIACNNVDYFSTAPGLKFKGCVECLQKSTKVDGNENDVSWFLYNLRYTFDVCMYGFPKAIKTVSSPCNINYACGPLQNALELGLLAPGNGSQYDYCTADGGAFTSTQVQACTQCLQASTDQSYLANFLTALEAGCKQMPAPGVLLGLTGALFSDVSVNITNGPASTDAATANSSSDSGTKVSIGAIVGIVVGGALLFIGGAAVFFVYFRKKRQQEREKELPMATQYPRSINSSIRGPPTAGGPPSGYALSFDHKKSMSISDFSKGGSRSYTSNGDYYDKLEEEVGRVRSGSNNSYNYDPRQANPGPNNAIPTHPAYIPQTMSRNNSPQPSPTPSGVLAIQSEMSKQEEYALQSYEDGPGSGRTTVASPPPPPPTGMSYSSVSTARSPPPNMRSPPASMRSPPGTIRSTTGSVRSASSSAMRSLGGQASPPMTTINGQLSPPPNAAFTVAHGGSPLPPPPPRLPKVPALVLPTVPRIRVPKKYAPPKIVVQGATPVCDTEESRALNISGPMAFPSQGAKRFVDRPLGISSGGGASVSSLNNIVNGRIVEHQVEIHPELPYTEPEEVRSGKSLLYG